MKQVSYGNKYLVIISFPFFGLNTAKVMEEVGKVFSGIEPEGFSMQVKLYPEEKWHDVCRMED